MYGPPVDREHPDLLGDEQDDDADDADDIDDTDDDVGESAVRAVVRAAVAPEAVALASVLLATVSLLGVGLLNGSPYLPPSFDGTPPEGSILVLTALLGAGLALLPVGLGAWSLLRLPEGSPARATAGAGVLVAGVSVVLRLVLAARTAADDGAPYFQF